jgi:hypothetical protein
MVNTLAAMHNLKGGKINFTQDFPQAKLEEDIYLQFPAGFEDKNEKWAYLNVTCTDSCKHYETGSSNRAQYMRG